MNPKSGVKRKGILVFTRFLKEAERLTWSIPGTAIVSGETPKKERERILERLKLEKYRWWPMWVYLQLALIILS